MNKEYLASLRSLTKENRKTILRMQHYLETCYLNEVVFEDIMSDLAGMAIESQKRGVSLSDTIGMDYKSFCRELAVNAKKQSFPERIFDVMTWICFFDGILVPILSIFYSLFYSPSYNIGDFTMIAPAGQLMMYVSVSTVLVIGWFLTKRFTYSAQAIVFSAYMAAVLLTFVLTDFFGKHLFGDKTVSISLFTWLATVTVLFVICYLAKRLLAFTIAYKNRKNG